MKGQLLCLVGLHKWTMYGDCERNSLHVQHRKDDWMYGGPWSRVAHQRHADIIRGARELQAELLTNWGEDVSDMVCEDAVRGDWEDDLRAIVAARAAAKDAKR